MAVDLPDHAKAVLDGPNFAYLGTVGADGAPHVTTMWIERDGGLVSINTVEGRVKWHNMRHEPRVSIAVHDRDSPYDNITIGGRVVAMTRDGAEEQIDRLARKYLGGDGYEWRRPGQVRVRVVIAVESVAG